MKSSGRSHQKPSQPPQNPEALIRDILIRAKQTGDDRKPNFASLLQIAVNDPEDTEIITLLEEKLQESEMAAVMNPDPFRASNPTLIDELPGSIVLGIIPSSGVPWCITPEMLTTHILIISRSGGGKSNTILILLCQLLEMRKNDQTV